MHEARICLSLLALAEEHRRRAGAERILALRVEVGEWSGIAPEALTAAFPICADATAARGAALHIERTAGRGLLLRDMEVC